MRERVAEFSAFMDRTRGLGSAVAADPARERELFEELTQAIDILTLLQIDLGVGALKVRLAKNTRCAVPRAGQKDHVEVILLDQAVQ